MNTTPHLDHLKLKKDYNHPAIVFSVVQAAGDANTVFIGTSEFKVQSANVSEEKLKWADHAKHESYVTSLAHTGQHVISGGYDGQLIWWNTAANKASHTVAAHAKWIRQIVLSPDGKLLASVADDMLLKLWDAESGKLVRTCKGHAEKTPHHFVSMLYAVCFSPDGQFVATADKTAHLIVWEVATGKIIAQMHAPVLYTWDKVQRLHSIGGARSVAFSPDGKTLAVGGMGKVGNIDHLEGKARLELFDWANAKNTTAVQSDKFSGLINHLAWAPDGTWLICSGGANEGFVLVYDTATQKFIKQEKAPAHIHSAWHNSDFTTFYCAGHHKLMHYSLVE